MISLYDILEAANGQLFGEPVAQLFTDFCLDYRKVKPTQIFVARRTDQGDTHQYIEAAIGNGASGIICTGPPDCDTTGVSVLMARDPEGALMAWAHIMLGKLGPRVIAVTGSSGKSIASYVAGRILATRYQVLEGNLDDEGPLSIPLALAQLNPNHQFVVLKLGIVKPGEMSEIVQSIQPDIGVITQIDFAHAAAFKNKEQVAREMSLLVEYLSPTEHAVLNYDSDAVREMAPRSRASVTTFGIDSFGSDLMAYNTVIGPSGTGFDLRHNSDRYVGRWIPFLGKQALASVLAALAVGLRFDIPIEESLKVLTDLSPLPGRMNPLVGKSSSLLIDDTYSANPVSTLAALEWLQDVKADTGRTIFVMGDMEDLGAQNQYSHRLLGKRAAEVADILITQGAEAALASRSALDHGMDTKAVYTTYSTQDTVAVLQNLSLNETDTILIKGGRAARMELIVQAFLDRADDRKQLVRQDSGWETAILFEHVRPSWIEIDTDALAVNVRTLKEILGQEVALMAVVKSNGYGHGAVTVARTALLNGADYLAVASMVEALELRDSGIVAPILVLSYTPVFAVRQAIQQNISVGVFDLEMARAYDRAAHEVHGRLHVHVKIDTGMGRLGVPATKAVAMFRHLTSLNNLEVEGIYTHFSSASSDTEYTASQIETFKSVYRPLRASGFNFRYIHASNSAGILSVKDSMFNMARPGIILYGLKPSDNLTIPDSLKPIMTWKTVVAQVRDFSSNSPIGYDNTYHTHENEKIAILPVGYGDGLRRAPQPWKEVLIKGIRAPLVGRISMEKCAVNVSHIPGVSVGDEVVLLGRQNDDEITAEEVAQWFGTSNYEVVTTILPRVPRQ